MFLSQPGGKWDGKHGTWYMYVEPGAYERQSREGACNSGSIQILTTYVFPFWKCAMRVMRSVTHKEGVSKR